MADQLKCPNCSDDMVSDRDFNDFACRECGLTGPREVILRVASFREAARVSSAAFAQANAVDRVLDEAGRLLTEAGATTGMHGGFALRRESDLTRHEGKTLSEAYRKLVEANRG